MPNADIAGNGAVWVGLETTYGTPVDPSASGVGVWVPIISENLAYTEAKYYSPQIRQSAIVSDAKQSYYHVEGDIVLEVDANYMPYFLFASRHTIAKTGAGPYVYSASPTNIGSTYPEADTAGAVTPSWIAASLFGADAHSVYVDAAGTAPSFASSDTTFNGFTWRANYNGAAQNRILPTRSATYISYGEIDSTYETELDFTSKTEYNNMKSNTFRSLKLESLKGGTPFASATEAMQIISYRSNYDSYVVGLSGIGDLLMARVTGRLLGITGGVPFKLVCKSPVNIT